MLKSIIVILTLLVLNSCGFLFYNYRANYQTEFTFKEAMNDTLLRHEIGEMILKLSEKEKFYETFNSANYDSLYFYGPDYHHLTFRLFKDSNLTKVEFDYFAWNGNRRKPPLKKFIQEFTDSLKMKFGASQVILKDLSNEK
jgi:hypothetical protein